MPADSGRVPDAQTESTAPTGAAPPTGEPPPAEAAPPAKVAVAGRRSGWRRIVPVLALLALAPWAAECSWGGFVVSDFLLVVVFLGPLYGGAAVLIRETARHLGAGWPAIVLLAAAFGVYQAGLVDQSLFNRAFLADTEFADLAESATATLVPVVGFSAREALDFVGNHIALSICTPIAIVESFLSPRRRHEPWLGWRGLAVVALLFALGSLLIFSDANDGRKGFLAEPLQLSIAVLVILALVGAALLPRWRRTRLPVARRAPRLIWVGLVTPGAGVAGWLLPGWAGVVLQVAVIVTVATVVVVWSRRTGWGQRHVLAAWAGFLLVTAAVAYTVPNYQPASPAEALLGDIAVSVIVVGLLAAAFWRLRGEDPTPGKASQG